ncbi:MAG: SxtJ family membrane protein [Magnetovibrio sp.]|nr:SxtJ family membrane protein [Magnetovibrio sp.]
MTRQDGFHENFQQGDEVRAGSERSFGLVFAVVFAIIGLWPLINALPVRIWALAIAAGFALAAFVAPKLLGPLNLIWFKFGMLLHKVVNPLVMGLLFFLTVTPIALIMRVLGKDPLRRSFDNTAASYWIEREPGDPAPESMRNQF